MRSKRARTAVFSIISALIAIGLTLFIANAVCLIVFGKNIKEVLSRRMWIARNQLKVPEPIGIWEDDPTFGWVHKPDSEGRHDLGVFDVTYHIDSKGNRITEGGYDQPKVLFLGGSFTFGHGVEDDEAYPYLLQKDFPGYKIVNSAVMAWGTGQSFLKLERQLGEYADIQLAVYSFVDHHLQRNYVRKKWLRFLKDSHTPRQNVHFEIEDGRLKFKGLARVGRDGKGGKGIAEMEERITWLMLAEMKKLCDASSIPFVVVYLPNGAASDFSRELKDIAGVNFFFDLREGVEYSKISFKLDGHPTAKGHQMIARSLAPVLKKFLEEEP
jgi:lysophospholipase L1-like esterase